ncbi:MAG: DUF3800 domain-containing protein [Calditrichaeota bacterium]|nr:DUF3800 domain-containing protein [Calditrichota bacterium]
MRPKKYRLYVDEVGDPGLGSESVVAQRYFSLTGIFLELSYVDAVVHPELEDLKRRHFAHKIHADEPLILHRKEIINKKPPFESLRDADRCAAFDTDLLGIVDLFDYEAITVVLDKAEHNARYAIWHYDPYHYCMTVLIERYARWLERHKQVGDVMAESRGGKADMRLKKSFRKLWENGTEWVSTGTIQSVLTSRELKLKKKDNNIAGLQLADIIAHPSHMYVLEQYGASENQARGDFGRRVTDILIKKKYVRHPISGEIKGWGIKYLP